jgi:hypothetical protein
MSAPAAKAEYGEAAHMRCRFLVESHFGADRSVVVDERKVLGDGAERQTLRMSGQKQGVNG